MVKCLLTHIPNRDVNSNRYVEWRYLVLWLIKKKIVRYLTDVKRNGTFFLFWIQSCRLSKEICHCAVLLRSETSTTGFQARKGTIIFLTLKNTTLIFPYKYKFFHCCATWVPQCNCELRRHVRTFASTAVLGVMYCFRQANEFFRCSYRAWGNTFSY